MRKNPDPIRRNFLKTSVIGAGALTAGFAGGLALPGIVHATATCPVLPLPYCKDSYGNPTSIPNSSNQAVLDPDDVRVNTWEYYFTASGGGMQACASGLMKAFKNAFSSDGTDWDKIAYGMYAYGGGGVGWGTLCGVVNGCMALLNLIYLHRLLQDSILGHYSETEWPTARIPTLYNDPYYGKGGMGGYSWTKQPVPDGEVLAKTVSNSPLCHNFVSKWCYAAGVNLGEPSAYGIPHKSDCCAKMCADMASYTAELINYYALTGAVGDPYTPPPETAECMTCHHKLSDTSQYPAQFGQMDCNECHTPGIYHAPERLIAVGADPGKVIARNLETRQTVVIQNPSGVFDCTNAGLTIQPGDRIDIIIKGTAD